MQPFNFVTMTEYSGKNALELSGPDFPAYATFAQVKNNGGMVKKGAHGVHIFCGYRDKTDKDGKTVRVPRGAVVFHIDDCDIDPGYRAEVVEQATAGKTVPSETAWNEQLMAAVLA